MAHVEDGAHVDATHVDGAHIVVKPITRLLVANRGEIARRIFRTAREMGISTAAIYADGDVEAPFVREADLAVALTGRTSKETYLDVGKVLDACKRSGADAVHPGYGFLSENAGFAKSVIDAGLAWIGPSPDVIAQMGDKLSAKKLMQEAGVPTLPAVELGPKTNVKTAAAKIGYPVLVKASAGGGGRGMRLVESPDAFVSSIESASREAQAGRSGAQAREAGGREEGCAQGHEARGGKGREEEVCSEGRAQNKARRPQEVTLREARARPATAPRPFRHASRATARHRVARTRCVPVRDASRGSRAPRSVPPRGGARHPRVSSREPVALRRGARAAAVVAATRGVSARR